MKKVINTGQVLNMKDSTQLTLFVQRHYIIMSVMVSQITNDSIVCSTIFSGTDQRKPQSSASLALVKGIRRSPADSLHKGPVMWKLFPFDDVIMYAVSILKVLENITSWWYRAHDAEACSMVNGITVSYRLMCCALEGGHRGCPGISSWMGWSRSSQ